MNPISEITSAIGKALNQQVSRPTYGGTSWGSMLSGLTGGPPANRVQMMQSYSTVGWLYRSISLIAEAVASVDWTLYQKQANGDREEVVQHPFLDLWKSPNPYMTHEVFLESQQQHIELTGEAYWLILPNAAGFPAELWPLRPDTVEPIRDAKEFIAGYLYRTGKERVRLPPEQVVCVKQPSPLDIYRGVGIVQALFSDLDSERLAALYNRNFFNNSAEPGGVIQFEQELTPAEFDRIQRHWGSLHRGVNNAHRVAVLERGEWKERKNTQSDMQFEQGRRLARDLIAGAFGIPLTMLGVSESVNRANAEAGEVVFSRWVVKTKLRRIKGAVNTRLLPWYGDPSLEIDFTDPTPEDKEYNLNEAERGYRGKFLTRNEARARVGEGEVEGGDEFDEASSPFTLSYDGGVVKGSAPVMQRAQKELSPAEKQQLKIQRNWTRRLKLEATAIITHLGQFLKTGSGSISQKIEIGDVGTHDWDWFEKYGAEVMDELTDAYELSLIEGAPDISDDVAKRLSATYATQRTSLLLMENSALSLTKFARARVNILVAETILNGDSLKTLRKKMEEDIGFSPQKAETVARTETATALGQGSKQAAMEDGRDEKRWMTQGDHLVSQDICRPNARAGWIPIADAFPCSTTGGDEHTSAHNGHDTIPGHPNCRCSVVYRTAIQKGVNPVDRVAVFRLECATCNKLLDKVGSSEIVDATAEIRWCPRCKERRGIRQVLNDQ